MEAEPEPEAAVRLSLDCSAADKSLPTKNLPSVFGKYVSTFFAARASAGSDSSTAVYWVMKSAAAGEEEAGESFSASAARALVRHPASPLPRSRTLRGLPLAFRSCASCEAMVAVSLAWPRRPTSTTSW